MAKQLELKVILTALDKASAPLLRAKKNMEQISALRANLKGSNLLQNQIEAYKEARKGIMGRDAEASVSKIRALKQQVDKLRQLSEKDPSNKGLAKHYKSIQTEAKKLEKVHKDKSSSLQKLEATLIKAGINTKCIILRKYCK